MKIGIIGAGNIGGNLGRRWAKGGHAIRFGVRNPDDAAALVQECGPHARAPCGERHRGRLGSLRGRT